MRISNNLGINNIYGNVFAYDLPENNYIFFRRNNTLAPQNCFSYLASSEYQELKKYIAKYDLSHIQVLDTEKLNYAISCRNDYEKEFGVIKSSSMQDLLQNPLEPNYDISLGTNINKMRNVCRKSSDYSKTLACKMREQKIGNCTDIALVTADKINKSQNKYSAKLLYASISKGIAISNHVAVFLKDKTDKDVLSSEAIVLDNWLGGVFKYADWVKIIKKLYKADNVSTYITNAK